MLTRKLSSRQKNRDPIRWMCVSGLFGLFDIAGLAPDITQLQELRQLLQPWELQLLRQQEQRQP